MSLHVKINMKEVRPLTLADVEDGHLFLFKVSIHQNCSTDSVCMRTITPSSYKPATKIGVACLSNGRFMLIEGDREIIPLVGYLTISKKEA